MFVIVLSGLTRNNVRIAGLNNLSDGKADRLLLVNTSYTLQNLNIEYGYQYRR